MEQSRMRRSAVSREMPREHAHHSPHHTKCIYCNYNCS